MANPRSTHDPADLFRAQWSLRANYHAIRRLRTATTDPLLRATLERLDEMASAMQATLDAEEPGLPLAVRHPVCVAGAAQRAVEGGSVMATATIRGWRSRQCPCRANRA